MNAQLPRESVCKSLIYKDYRTIESIRQKLPKLYAKSTFPSGFRKPSKDQARQSVGKG